MADREKVGLVLEGGGLRGLYTSGVLDYLMTDNIAVDNIVGVSAGVCNAVSFMSGQVGRSRVINVDYAHDRKYRSWGNLLFHGSYFGMKYMFETIPNKLEPFDYETFSACPAALTAVVTDCGTGKALYLPVTDLKSDYRAAQASCSLPLLSKMVDYDGHKLLDGGISDSIPLAQSMAQGYKKNIVVLTQNEAYRKKPNSMMSAIRLKYKKFPALVDAIEYRHLMYNAQLDFVKECEDRGECIVIRPCKSVEVGRLEKNKKKMDALHSLGFSETKDLAEKIREFVGG